MLKKIFFICAIAAFICLISAVATAADKPVDDPRDVAHQTVDKLIDAMDGRRKELKNNPKALYKLVDKILVPLVDTDYMSQLVLGRHWRDASDEQKQRFEEAFKAMLIRTYGNALLDFKKDQIEYAPIRADEHATDITFKARITTDSGEKIPVNLRMHLVDGQWKVYDGRVGNLSFVSNYRSQFNSYIRKNGLDKLIKQMEKRYGIEH